MSFGDAVRNAMNSELIEPPRGQYKTRLDKGEAFESKDGRRFAKVTLQITDGDLKGESFEHFMAFQPDGIAQMNGNACASYGVDWTQVKELSDLDDQLGALVAQGTTAEVGVSYKDGYMNVNVHGSRTNGTSDIPTTTTGEPAGQASFAAAAGAKSDDGSSDVPF